MSEKAYDMQFEQTPPPFRRGISEGPGLVVRMYDGRQFTREVFHEIFMRIREIDEGSHSAYWTRQALVLGQVVFSSAPVLNKLDVIVGSFMLAVLTSWLWTFLGLELERTKDRSMYWIHLRALAIWLACLVVNAWLFRIF
jgi:hypothetical protein